jgi:hypothetical protein
MWKLKGLVPGGTEVSFEELSDRPGVFRPLLSALWRVCVDCIPPTAQGTLVAHRRYLGKFGKFLATHADPSVRELSSLNALKRETLIDYRAWLFRELAASDAGKTYRSFARLLLTLREETSPWPGVVAPDLEIPTKALLPRDYGSTAVSPYTKCQPPEHETCCGHRSRPGGA